MTQKENLKALIEGMRPAHWLKNVFILAAIPFGRKFFHLEAWAVCGVLVIAFCGLASAVYLFNDMQDREADRRHPEKQKRAIASGRLPTSWAVPEAILLLLVSMALIAWLDILVAKDLPLLSLCGTLYVVINVLYTLRIKNIPILDVLSISMGFVIRVVAGALAIQVPVSPWLIVCTFMLSLFIGITKRRSEVLHHSPETAREIRNTNAFYTPERLEHMISVAASLAIMSYSLYCVSPQTQERVGSLHLVWTIPVVIYGIFRYYCLSGASGYGDPVHILLKDRGMVFTLLAWIVLVLLIIYL